MAVNATQKTSYITRFRQNALAALSALQSFQALIQEGNSLGVIVSNASTLVTGDFVGPNAGYSATDFGNAVTQALAFDTAVVGSIANAFYLMK